jgi:hypothetical protein
MKASNELEVERGVTATALEIDESKLDDLQAHPIKLTLRHLTDEELAASLANGLFRSPAISTITRQTSHIRSAKLAKKRAVPKSSEQSS